MSKTPKELFYDTKIAPIVSELISACREGDVQFIASFCFDSPKNDEDFLCTTYVESKGSKNSKHLQKARMLIGPL